MGCESPGSPGIMSAEGANLTVELPCGSIIDERYQITLLLGEGGMGSVYKAFDPTLDRSVAIKILKRSPGEVLDEDVASRFRLEGKILSKLSHPHLLNLYQLGICERTKIHYIVTEYLEGQTLREVLDNEGQLGSAKCLTMAIQICQAMMAVHAEDIIHRDLKPNNIMLLNYPEEIDAKVLDFGIAKLMSIHKSSHITQSGSMIGSPFYMSPEQFGARKVDCRSDIYALGCLLYECISGEPPFIAANFFGLMHSHVTQRPKPLRLLSQEPIPEGLTGIVERCMQKNPEERYQSMEQLLCDFRLVAAGAGDDLPTKPVEKGKETASIRFAQGPVIFFISLLTIGIVLLPSPLEWYHSKTADSSPTANRRQWLESDTKVSSSIGEGTYRRQCEAAYIDGQYGHCIELCRHYIEVTQHAKAATKKLVWAMLLEARSYDYLGGSSGHGPEQDGYFAQVRVVLNEIFQALERDEDFLHDGNTVWSDALVFSFFCCKNGPTEANAIYNKLLSRAAYADPRRLRQLQFARAIYLSKQPGQHDVAKHEFASLIELDEKLYGTASVYVLVDELWLFDLMTSEKDRKADALMNKLLALMANPRLDMTSSSRFFYLLTVADQAARGGNCDAVKMLLKSEVHRSDYQPLQRACLHGHLGYVYDLESRFDDEVCELGLALQDCPEISCMEPSLLDCSKWNSPDWWKNRLAVLKKK